MMHIPPGTLEGSDDGARWFTDQTNKRFIKILRTYADIMLGMYAGHQHHDSFRIIYDFGMVLYVGLHNILFRHIYIYILYNQGLVLKSTITLEVH